MALSFDAFFYGLTQQESGGDWEARGAWVNSSRAYGRYQVMDFNVGPWTAKYYGRRLTPEQFLRNRAAQETVARGRLKDYVKWYGGYRQAAAAWYSGDPSLHMSTSRQRSGPPIKTYVDQVLAKARGYRGGGSSGGGGGAGQAFGSGIVAINKGELAEKYGLSSRMINSSKELKRLFDKAVKGGWSADRFQASLRNTKWWKTQSSSVRKYIFVKYSDPKTWKQKWGQYQYSVNQLAVAAGIGNQIKSNGRSTELLKDAIYKRFALGWNDARVKDWLGARAKTHGGIMWGEAGEAFDKLHAMTYALGLTYSGSWYANYARDVASGKTTIETLESKLRREAGEKYYAWKNQIRAGQNVMDLAAPYIKSVATILELPETDIDVINNKYVIKAMTSTVAKGKAPATQYPLWKFEQELREDPLWRKTNNARESMFTTARQVLKDFGVGF